MPAKLKDAGKRCETLCESGAESLKASYSKRWGSASGVLMGKRSQKKNCITSVKALRPTVD